MTRPCFLFALLALTLAACSPVVQPFGDGKGTPSLGDEALVAADGQALPLRRWETESPRAVVIALHGFNDYGHAFEDSGQTWRQQGIALYAYDQRGFGQSGQRGIWAGSRNLEQDVVDAATAVSAVHPGVPIYLLGESMGGAVVLSALADRQADMPAVKGAILVAPALWGADTMNGFYRSTLWLAAHTLPAVTVTGKNLRILASDNLEMLRALGRDPLVIKQTRIDAIYGMVDLMGRGYRSVPKIELPLLVVYGARDQVIPKEPILKSLDRFEDGSTKIAFYDEGWHMLLRDLQGPVVRQDIASWIADPAAPLPSGSDRDWKERMIAAPDPRATMAYGPRRMPPFRWHHKPALVVVR